MVQQPLHLIKSTPTFLLRGLSAEPVFHPGQWVAATSPASGVGPEPQLGTQRELPCSLPYSGSEPGSRALHPQAGPLVSARVRGVPLHYTHPQTDPADMTKHPPPTPGPWGVCVYLPNPAQARRTGAEGPHGVPPPQRGPAWPTESAAVLVATRGDPGQERGPCWTLRTAMRPCLSPVCIRRCTFR